MSSKLWVCDMLILLSPAKSLDFNRPLPELISCRPRFHKETQELISQLKNLDSSALQALMHLSPKLAELNYDRFQAYDESLDAGRPALCTFTGDVYQGMDLDAWTDTEYQQAEQQIRILSGLYGVLRPMDRIQAHRLEMGTPLANHRGKNLYHFWGARIASAIAADLAAMDHKRVINLASKEYFSSVQTDRIEAPIIEPVFQDEKNGRFKIISFYAKKARGRMADYIIRQRIQTAEELYLFNADGYRYSPDVSTELKPVFRRATADAN
jgi:cytoplasmic iron level regulating protein YaaA (DUF328/UPF0246 family)